jgi:hypothetical protein
MRKIVAVTNGLILAKHYGAAVVWVPEALLFSGYARLESFFKRNACKKLLRKI